ncbi:MAG: L-histidine N(alpha)-methyltransferase [Polyangia bacterium]
MSLPSARAYQRQQERSPSFHDRAAGLRALAAAIRAHLRPAPLDVLALGTGDGAHEVRLVQHLLEAHTAPLSLCLQDLSEPLLSWAYQRAAERLLPHARLELWALLADLEELSAHADLLSVSGRQRLVLLLGGTLGELTDALRFVRYGVAWCEPGDLLVLDVPLAVEGSEEEIWTQQGEAAQRALDAAREWLTAGIAPHTLGVPLEWSLHLEHPECLPARYAWCALATVGTDPRPCEIEAYRRRHYDAAELAASLDRLGWQLLVRQRYGSPAVGEMHLYRRRAPSLPAGRRRASRPSRAP